MIWLKISQTNWNKPGLFGKLVLWNSPRSAWSDHGDPILKSSVNAALDADTDIHVPLFWVTQYTKIVRYLGLILDLFSKLGK